MKQIIFTALVLLSNFAIAQKGIIQGRVYNAINNEPLPFAAVLLENTTIGTTTDIDGNFKIADLQPGLYNVQVQFIGFKSRIIYEVQVTNTKPVDIDFPLEEESQQLQEVVITAQTRFEKTAESPVSLKKLGINEIQRNPGGNQDISRVIQSLPGVASGVAFRNDLIIRGGGPNENRFYLEGIEIPAINHFATQGSSGGPVGMINVQFIKDVDFYTGAFPVNRGNTMSSMMEINLKDGRTDRIGGILQLGASEAGITLEGPLSSKTTYLVSARQSYLQFLFSALELPFLPTYNDFQLKVKHSFNRKNQLTVIGLGAIDQFKLNLDANETPSQQYILNVLPVNEQWNYSIGAKYTNFREKSYTNVVLSRFMLNNESYKFANNDESNTKLLDYVSQEIENKLRVENFYRSGKLGSTIGFNFEEVKYYTTTVDKRLPNGRVLDYTSDLRLLKYGLFGNVSYTFFNRLDVSAGLRTDGINFNSNMGNLLNQLSPRIAASYNITDAFSLNANWGIYYQLPPYTTMGFRNNEGELVNTDLKYIRSRHWVAGFAYLVPWSGRIAVEGFHKKYSQYPFLIPDSVSLANLGGDFGVVGNSEATSTNEGLAYGVEFSYEQKLFQGFYGIAAVTLVRSKFEDKRGELIPSSWDNRYLISLTAGKRFGQNWELGFQYQLIGGTPYTPYDLEASALQQNWDNLGRGVFDVSQLNTQRLESFNRLNLRLTRRWYFEQSNLELYFDLQNALGLTVQGQPFVDVIRDTDGNPVVDPNRPDSYLITSLPNEVGTLLPSVGVIFQF
jgi:hypothetical protein